MLPSCEIAAAPSPVHWQHCLSAWGELLCIRSLHTPGQGAHGSATMPGAVGCIQPALQAMGELRAALGCCSKQRLHAHKEVRPEEVVKPRTKGWGGCLCPCSLSAALGGRTCPAAPLACPSQQHRSTAPTQLPLRGHQGRAHRLPLPHLFQLFGGGSLEVSPYECKSGQRSWAALQAWGGGGRAGARCPGGDGAAGVQGLPCPGDVSSSQQGKRKQILYILGGVSRAGCWATGILCDHQSQRLTFCATAGAAIRLLFCFQSKVEAG